MAKSILDFNSATVVNSADEFHVAQSLTDKRVAFSVIHSSLGVLDDSLIAQTTMNNTDTIKLREQGSPNVSKNIEYQQLLLNIFKTSKNIERPQSVQSGRADANGAPDFLAILGSQVNILAGDSDPDLVLNVAGGKSTVLGDIDYQISLSDIDGIIDPANWDFSLAAAGRWRLYVELNVSDPLAITVTYNKWNGGTGSNPKKIENLITETAIPYTPAAGDQYYNRHDRIMYRYSGSVWNSVVVLHIGSVTCDGAGNLSDLTMYDFGAITKIDFTKYSGGNVYEFYQGEEPDLKTLIVNGANYAVTFNVLPVNALGFCPSFAMRDGVNFMVLATHPGDVTGSAYIALDDVNLDGILGQWADEGSNNRIGARPYLRVSNKVLTVIEFSNSAGATYYRNKMAEIKVKE